MQVLMIPLMMAVYVWPPLPHQLLKEFANTLLILYHHIQEGQECP